MERGGGKEQQLFNCFQDLKQTRAEVISPKPLVSVFLLRSWFLGNCRGRAAPADTCTTPVPRDPRAAGKLRVTSPALPGSAETARTCLALPLVARDKIPRPQYSQLPGKLRDSQALLAGLQLGSQRGRHAATALPRPFPPGGPGSLQEKLSPLHHHWNQNVENWLLQQEPGRRAQSCEEEEGAKGHMKDMV